MNGVFVVQTQTVGGKIEHVLGVFSRPHDAINEIEKYTGKLDWKTKGYPDGGDLLSYDIYSALLSEEESISVIYFQSNLLYGAEDYLYEPAESVVDPEECPQCHGTGIWIGTTCPKCDGNGDLLA